MKEGDILFCERVCGRDNLSFFEVVEVTRRGSVVLQQIGGKKNLRSPRAGTPLLPDPGMRIGEPLFLMICPMPEGGEMVMVDGTIPAYLWREEVPTI